MSDTPANCTYEDIEGVWDFYETVRNGDADIDCSKQGRQSSYRYKLSFNKIMVFRQILFKFSRL